MSSPSSSGPSEPEFTPGVQPPGDQPGLHDPHDRTHSSGLRGEGAVAEEAPDKVCDLISASPMAPSLMLPRHSATMFSQAIPLATCSSTSATRIRVPRKVGCPWQIFGSLTM
jgi:hypothetical protein